MCFWMSVAHLAKFLGSDRIARMRASSSSSRRCAIRFCFAAALASIAGISSSSFRR